MNLLLNAVQCLSCNEVIVSRHRHDYKSCKCGNVSVDGGLDYKRRGFKTEASFVERCAYTWDPKYSRPGDAAGKFLVWSPGGRTNPGVVFDMKDDAELSAKELAAKVPPSDWYVAQLSHVPQP
jgi:hypothetical protein